MPKEETWLVQWSNGNNLKNKRGSRRKQFVYSAEEAVTLAGEKQASGCKMVKWKKI